MLEGLGKSKIEIFTIFVKTPYQIYELANMDSSLSIDRIKYIINGLLSKPEIILFGSRARGDDKGNSDYDLLIILENSVDIPERLRYQSLIRKVLAEHDINSDVIIQSRDDFEIKKNLPGHIVRSAFKEGVRL